MRPIQRDHYAAISVLSLQLSKVGTMCRGLGELVICGNDQVYLSMGGIQRN